MKKHVFKIRVLLIIGVINILFMAQSKLFAQGDFGCGDEDPSEDCPIDTWVYLLVVLIVILAVYNLWKKKDELRLSLKT